MKLLQASTIFKQIDNPEVFWNWNFYIKLFTSLNSKNIIASLRIVTVKISELTLFLILNFHTYVFQKYPENFAIELFIIFL